MSISIRPVADLTDLAHFNALEHLIWGTPLPSTVPIHVAVTTIHNGGGLLGAFAPDGPAATGGMVGLVYWWPGLAAPPSHQPPPDDRAPQFPPAHQPSVDDRAPQLPSGYQPSPHDSAPAPLQLKMCSHMAGVLPAWRGTGLGLRLKLAQRAAILAQGMTTWVTWTYDPLIRANGVFNLHRLGAVCSTYHVNVYGEMEEGINAGTPSDRCQVDWWLDSPRVEQLAQEGSPAGARRTEHHLRADTQTVAAEVLPRGLLAPPTAAPRLDGRPLALPLPDDIYAIRAADPRLGRAWRQWQRESLSAAFAAGYLLIDCHRHSDNQWRYLLQQP